ncbi:MAG TPA: hypothetical protein VN598_06185 [Usitatibacter sp.]|nr:hypothetical protein [Usitatibacter sp.]
MKAHFLAAALAAVVCGCASVGGSVDIGGIAPAYLDNITAPVPNLQALGRRFWTPALDEGFVPQGLTIADGAILVSSYHPMPDLNANTGPCRVFRIDMGSGNITGSFDLPVGQCTHSGGLAYLGDGQLMLADTRQLFRIDLARAFATGKAEGAMKAVKIAGELRGSFAGANGADAWIGTWTKEAPHALLWRLKPGFFDEFDGRTVDEKEGAVESVPIPLEVQGLAFDGAGDPWVTASNSKWGKLYHLGHGGAVKAQYEMVAGLEDIEFDDLGRLWGLSESGTKKYMKWATHFPNIFEIDVTKLR